MTNQNEPAGPAKITALHEERPATDDDFKAIIGKVAYRKNSVLEVMFSRGKMGEGQIALNRLDAGRFYSNLWYFLEPHGRDSTQALNGTRTGGFGIPLSLMQQDAGRALASIGSHLGAKDRIILNAVCKDDCLPHVGVKLAQCDKETRVFARFRDALDELIVAIEKSRTSNFSKFNLEAA